MLACRLVRLHLNILALAAAICVHPVCVLHSKNRTTLCFNLQTTVPTGIVFGCEDMAYVCPFVSAKGTFL